MIHYKYGGSTAKRTLACPSWVALSAGVPKVVSEHAKKGTAGHWLLEQRNLDEDFDFASYLGKACPEEPDIVYDQELIDLVEEMWAADEAVMEKYDVEGWEAETTGVYDEDIGSTVDKVFLGSLQLNQDGDMVPLLGFIDYKTGRGEQIEAEGNPQLFHNAMCLRESSSAKDMFEGVEHFVGIIIQPGRDGEVQIREAFFTNEDIKAFNNDYLDMVDLADDIENGLVESAPSPGDHCTFCPASPTCPAKTGEALRALHRKPEDLALLAENMAMVEGLEKWCNAVVAAAHQQLEVGADVTGFKLVAKRATEKWKAGAEDVIARLRTKCGGKKAMVDEKLKTPAQLRKVLQARGHDIDFIKMGLSSKDSSGTTVVPESDKRDAVLSAQALGAALASVE